MPTASSRKRAANEDAYEEDDFVENDDGRAAKKSKTRKTSNTATFKTAKNGIQKDDEGFEYWEVCSRPRVFESTHLGRS